MANDYVSRFLGGPPLAVFGKLVLLSILVGVVLSVLGFDPREIIKSVGRLLNWIWQRGFQAIFDLWDYFLLGAVIVVPIWLVMRLARAPRERPPAV